MTSCFRLFFIALLAHFPLVSFTFADKFELKNGSVLQGRWLNHDDKNATAWVFEVDGGIQLELPRNEVKSTLRQSKDVELYLNNVTKADDSIATHQKMVDGCVKLGLPDLADAHRERLVELDPSDKTVWAALDYVKAPEGWIPKEQAQRQRGMQQKGGRWYIPQDLAIAESEEQAKIQIAEINKKIQKAIEDVRRNGPKAEESRRYLLNLNDPLAVKKLEELLKKDRSNPNTGSPAFRRQLLDILNGIRSESSVYAIVDSAINDPDDSIRMACIETLSTFGKEIAVQVMMGQLVNNRPNKDNPVTYDRIGIALVTLGDERCLARLIDCLVTKHLIEPPPQPKFQVGQNNNGGVNMAQGQPKAVERQVSNQGVLSALTELSGGESFGFDKQAWLDWYAEKYAPRNPYVVRDP
jgi:hypothetical protein